MSTIQQWLSEYSYSHLNKANKQIHWICIPVIFFSITGLLYAVKLPFTVFNVQANLAMLVMILITFYYLHLSHTLWIGMVLFGAACLYICHLIETSGIAPLWVVCIVLFVLAWIGQFYGHKIEGKKPSFFKDIQFLLIGPAWLMSSVYRKLGIGL